MRDPRNEVVWPCGTCFDASWNSFIICSQAPVKLKLKMRKDLSDKEINDISVSSTSLCTEFAAYLIIF